MCDCRQTPVSQWRPKSLRSNCRCFKDVPGMTRTKIAESGRFHMSQDSSVARRSTLCSLAKALGAPGEPAPAQMAPAGNLGRHVCASLSPTLRLRLTTGLLAMSATLQVLCTAAELVSCGEANAWSHLPLAAEVACSHHSTPDIWTLPCPAARDRAVVAIGRSIMALYDSL